MSTGAATTDDFIRIAYFVVEGEDVSVKQFVQILKDALVSDLLVTIGLRHKRDGRLRLWKSRQALRGEQANLMALLEEANGDFPAFCDNLSSEEEMYRGVSGLLNRNREASTTALIVEVLPVMSFKRKRGDDDRDEGESDPLGNLKKKFKTFIKEGCKYSPSVSSQPTNYKTIQEGPTPILDGRYGDVPNTLGLPVDIVHPVFAKFRALVADESEPLPEELVESTAKLMTSASLILTAESSCQQPTRELLSELLSHGETQTTQTNHTSANHSFFYVCIGKPLGAAASGVVEEKSELGLSGEGSVQGSFSYLQHWVDPSNKALAEACCCPSFIISIAGPWITVLGAVFTSHVVVQRLTGYLWLGNSHVINDEYVFQVARVFHALRRSMHDLKDFYAKLAAAPKSSQITDSRFFPLATTYVTSEGKKNSFRYIRPLKGDEPSCTTFLTSSTENPGQLLVVKFVERYCEEAHTILMREGRAPELLYYGAVWLDGPEQIGCGRRKMVVMKYVPGEVAVDGVSVSVRNAVQDAVGILHRHDLVHGDIRRPNILIADGDGDEGERMMILDFDWSGKEGETRYPLFLSKIRWAAGVKDNGLIKKEHDLEMITFL